MPHMREGRTRQIVQYVVRDYYPTCGKVEQREVGVTAVVNQARPDAIAKIGRFGRRTKPYVCTMHCFRAKSDPLGYCYRRTHS